MVASSIHVDPEWSSPKSTASGVADSTPGTLWNATYETAGADCSVLARDRCRHHEPLPLVHCLCRAPEETTQACQQSMDAARKSMESGPCGSCHEFSRKWFRLMLIVSTLASILQPPHPPSPLLSYWSDTSLTLATLTPLCQTMLHHSPRSSKAGAIIEALPTPQGH